MAGRWDQEAPLVCRAMIGGCLGACTSPDPNDPHHEPFHADVIMANPMCLGHIHCAEALGVPLHLFFPNPWVATQEYPHSFSGWHYPSISHTMLRFACLAAPRVSNETAPLASILSSDPPASGATS